ncbi:MAG: hypothetical protein R3B82_23285 [Sandaracinaceae bacterium]
MAAPHAQPRSDAWARANLTRGSSGGQIWEISAEYPEARLTLGSDPSAGWCIEAHGVAPVHCELFWDGQALWVADIAQVGGVFLDGMRVSDWVQIHGPAELRFGQAAMDIETSVPAAQQMMSNPQTAKPVTVTDFVLPPEQRPSSPLFGGAAGDLSVPDLDSEKTRMVVPVLADELSTHDEPLLVPEPSLDLRPRLGGAVGSVPAGGAHASEATRMVPIPTPSAPAGPPKIGTPIGAPMAGAAMPPMVPLAGPPAPVVAPPPAAPHVPAPPLPSPPQHGAPALGAPPGAVAPDVDQGLGFDPSMGFAAPPPPIAPKEEKALAKVWDKIKPEKPETTGKQAMPTRTWILLGVTVAVTVGWLLWDDTPEEVAEPARPAVPAEATPAPGPTAEPSAPDPVPPPVAEANPTVEPAPVENAGDPPPVAEVTAPPSSSGDDGSEGSDGETDGPTLARRAADAYSAGDLAASLAAYRELASQDPSEPAYGAMVRILERRVAEQEERER